jgi:hypothetical protein
MTVFLFSGAGAFPRWSCLDHEMLHVSLHASVLPLGLRELVTESPCHRKSDQFERSCFCHKIL